MGTKHMNLHQSFVTMNKVTYLMRWPAQELALATANTGKTEERFWGKNEGKWTGKVEFSKKEIPGSYV